MPVTRTTSKSSGRVIAKWAQRRLTTTLPDAARRASISSWSTGTHEPQPVPAFVQPLMPGTSSKPSSTAARTAPHDTLWHEHTPASSGRSAGVVPDAPAVGRSSPSTSGVRTVPRTAWTSIGYGRGVADEDGAEHLALGADHDALPRAGRRVGEDDVVALGVRVAGAGDVDAEQLERRRHVGAGERGGPAGEAVGDDLGHAVAGGDEPVDPPAVAGDLADRVDVRRRRGAAVVDDDAAALADLQAGVAGELVAWPDAGREHDHVGVEVVALGERQAGDAAVGRRAHGGRGGAGADLEPERLDVAAQGAAAAVVELHGHQAGRELDDRRADPEQAQRVGGLQAEQPAADDGAGGRIGGPLPDGVEVVERPVDERRRRRRCPGIGGTNGAEPVASTHAR